nr:hypothetical protein Iba_chr01bCG1640 [Ipomoea batatas]GMC56598.1 hypothetical protein Iba_chr01fCG8640 [Ipomoea batatas]
MGELSGDGGGDDLELSGDEGGDELQETLCEHRAPASFTYKVDAVALYEQASASFTCKVDAAALCEQAPGRHHFCHAGADAKSHSFCHADTTFLYVTCDSKIHATNKIHVAALCELHLQGRRRCPLRHLRPRLPLCQWCPSTTPPPMPNPMALRSESKICNRVRMETGYDGDSE